MALAVSTHTAKGASSLAAVAQRTSVQTSSLRVSSPADLAEREATTTARKVVNMSVPEVSQTRTAPASPGVFRRIQTSSAAVPLVLRRHESGTHVQCKTDGETFTSPEVASQIQSQKGGGSPLPPAVRKFMEPRFRADFSGVRVHTGESAAKLNRQLSARAFATGNDIFFGRDRFKPENPEGKELIAHELTHTIQQRAVVQRSEDVAVAERVPAQVQGALFDL